MQSSKQFKKYNKFLQTFELSRVYLETDITIWKTHVNLLKNSIQLYIRLGCVIQICNLTCRPKSTARLSPETTASAFFSILISVGMEALACRAANTSLLRAWSESGLELTSRPTRMWPLDFYNIRTRWKHKFRLLIQEQPR